MKLVGKLCTTGGAKMLENTTLKRGEEDQKENE
jgi:hypothetical protein